MKITQIEAIPVKVPYHDGITEMMVERNLYQGNTVYKVHTDAGLVGIGEAEGQPDDGLQQYVGRDPFEFMNGLAPTPFQQAAYDIMGKALGVPVHQLVGDKVQDKVAIGYWSIDMPPAEWAEEAKRAYSLGYRLHKIKARPWHDIIEQVEAITEVVPSDYKLRIDPNDSFETPAKSIEVAKKLRDYNIEAFESPIPQGDIDGYLEIRNGCDMPITIHFGNPDPVEAIKAGMNDSFIIAYPDSRAANAKREASISESAHLPLWIQIVGMGITTTYLIHLAATMPNATMSSITLNCLRAFDIVTPAVKMENGYATVPDTPGLGIEFDEDLLDNCRE